MSGFLVSLSKPGCQPDREQLDRAAAGMATIGPDAQMVSVHGRFGCAFARLEVLPESTGERQPFCIGSKLVVGSGRLDQRHLLGGPINLPDMEIAGRVLAAGGDEAIDRLYGDFSLGIYDQAAGRLTGYRDFFGTKPLYWAETNDTYLLSNSLSTLHAWHGVDTSLNENTVADFCLFNMTYRVDKTESPFRGIHSVPPGGWIKIDDQGVRTGVWRRCPGINPKIESLRGSDIEDAFRVVLRDCVTDRLRSNKVAMEMSGGTDSTSVAALAAESFGESRENIKAFTIHYSRIHEDDEVDFAKAAAEQIGISHEFIECDDLPPYDPECWDLNLMRAAVFVPGWVTAQKTSSYSRTVLNAYSADSLIRPEPPSFLTYLLKIKETIYLQRELGRRLPVGFKNRADHLLGRDGRALYEPPKWIDPDFANRTHMRDRWMAVWEKQTAPLCEERPALSAAVFNQDWTERFVDIMPFETRDPFMDRRILEFVTSIESFPLLANKSLLRLAMRDLVPEQVLKRKKTPLGAAIQATLRGSEGDWVNDWEPAAGFENYGVYKRAVTDKNAAASDEELFSLWKARMLNEWLKGL
jgi:asparagine synthase (glutamine-hydrolysing)